MKKISLIFLLAILANTVLIAQPELNLESVTDPLEASTSIGRSSRYTMKNHRFSKHGLIFQPNIATSIGQQRSTLDLDLGLGYLVTPYTSIGVGLGMHSYLIDKGWKPIVPFYGEIHLYASKKKYAPFLACRIGYSFDPDDLKTAREGQYFSPSVGCRIMLAPNMGMNASVGYTYQDHANTVTLNFGSRSYKSCTRAITLRIGFVF